MNVSIPIGAIFIRAVAEARKERELEMIVSVDEAGQQHVAGKVNGISGYVRRGGDRRDPGVIETDSSNYRIGGRQADLSAG